MRTYVAEINGEAIMACRAEDDDGARALVNEENGGLQLGLDGFSGLLRADGRPLWDGESEITSRRATDEEHKQWLNARDSEIGSAYEGKLIDLSLGDDPDSFNVYLLDDIKPVDDDDDDE